MELAAKVAEERPSIVGERGREPIGRIERLRDLDELRRVEPAAARRPFDGRADVVGGPDPDPRTLLE